MAPRVLAAAGPHGLVLLAFVALAVLLTWPLLPNLATHLPGTALDDNACFLWDFWWFRRAAADPAASLLSTTALFHPGGVSLALHAHVLLLAAPGGTLLGGAPLTVALNLTLLASCALNGFSVYLLAFRLTGHRSAALVAGVFFAASPLFVTHFLGHFNRYAAWPLVFFVRAWLIALERPSAATGIVAGAWLAAVAYVDYYYFVYGLVFAATVLLCGWLDIDLATRRPSRTRIDTVLLVLGAAAAVVAVVIHVTGGLVWTAGPMRISLRNGTNVRALAAALIVWWWWRGRRWTITAARPVLAPSVAASFPALRPLALLFGTAVLLLTPVLASAFELWRQGEYVTQSYVWRNAPPGIDVGAMLLGNAFHGWWGNQVARLHGALGIDSLAPQLWLGFVPLLLFFTRRAWITVRAARTWMLYGGVFFIWTLGPFLRVFGVDTGLPLPQILLRYVPVASNARLPPHAAVMVYLAVAVLVAYALANWPFRRPRLAAAALTAAILADFVGAPVPVVALEHAPLFERLAQRPAGAVLDVPVGIRDSFGPEGRFDAAVLYHQTLHGKPLVTGYVSRLPPAVRRRYHDSPAMRALFAASSDAPLPADAADSAAAATELASRWNVRYIVVDERNAPPAVQRFVEAMPAAMIDRDQFRRVYELRTP